jgi:hypothetical protein
MILFPIYFQFISTTILFYFLTNRDLNSNFYFFSLKYIKLAVFDSFKRAAYLLALLSIFAIINYINLKYLSHQYE